MSTSRGKRQARAESKATSNIPEAAAAPESTVNTPEASAVPKSTVDADIAARRSVSMFPTPIEAMNDLSLKQRETRSKTVGPSNRRRPLLSAVPDSAVLTPVRRPAEYGKAGRPISVFTNHFPVSIDDAIINQYDIDIVMINRDKQPRQARKDERWEALRRIAEHEKNFPLVWYDEGKNLYTRELLTDFTKPIEITFEVENEKKTFRLTVNNLVRQEKVRNIFDFINGQTSIRPRDPVRIIETLFKQRARNDLVNVRHQFYDRRQRLDDLGDGRGLASGFYQALCLTKAGPTLNFSLAFTCFYQPMNFVDFACDYLRKDITKEFTESDQYGFTKLARSLLIETFHTSRNMRYRVYGFGLPANKLTFPLGDNDETENPSLTSKITVAEYFATKYKKLKYPHLPCIDARKGDQPRAHWLPMEVVQIVPWQRSLRPLDSVQSAKVTKKAIIAPEQRYNLIMDIVRKCDFDTDPYLKALNIHVDTQEMLQVKARVLPPPEIKYRAQNNSEVVERVSVGKWTIRNRFYATHDVDKWSIIYFAPNRPDQNTITILKDFQNQLPALLQRYGIFLKRQPIISAKPARKEDVETTMKDASKNGCQLAFIILNDTLNEIYADVKRWGNQYLGVITQCVSFQALERNISKLNMYVQNLSQKINAKLGGINGIVNLKATLSRPSNEDLFMFFGADVTHTTCSSNRPSIAAVVGSRDPTGSLYAARICEQYPEKGRCSVEIIKELDKMVIELLQVFARSCGNRLPTKIVFYRDGVDDGQFQKVLDNEVNKVKAACHAIYGNRPQPKLTFIIVKKRHNTRFFLYNGQTTNNMEPGTVIDQTITHPFQFDFYLCSQAALKGTSRPALYHVLHDEIGFSSDEIQQLTYWLCHTDARCSKSVSIPAPVHYADLAAGASNVFDFHDDRDAMSVDDWVENCENISLEDIQSKLMILNSNVADKMWFV